MNNCTGIRPKKKTGKYPDNSSYYVRAMFLSSTRVKIYWVYKCFMCISLDTTEVEDQPDATWNMQSENMDERGTKKLQLLYVQKTQWELQFLIFEDYKIVNK